MARRIARAPQRRSREAPRRGAPADDTAARELVMYIENESDLSPDGPRGQGRDVLLNALRKYRKGTYDPTLALKLFAYLVESGAKRYAKEFGSSEREWSTMFPPATRQEAARQLEASFRNSAEQGEYDRIDVRTGGAAGANEAPRSNKGIRGIMKRDVERNQAEYKHYLIDAVYNKTHPDYRSILDGRKAVLINGPRGATLTPLEGMKTFELERMLHSDVGVREEPRGRPGRVDDYIAVDRRGRRTAGPFKHYGDARTAAGTADHVQFVPAGRHVSERNVDRTSWYVDGYHGDKLASTIGPFSSKQEARGKTPHGRGSIVWGDPYQGMDMGHAMNEGGRRMRDGDQLSLPGSDEHDGEQYADEQLNSDYFKDWIWDQMADGAKLAPEARIPLETPADFKRLARRMLQDLEFDTKRQHQGSKEFFEGMRRRLNDKSTIEWLAEELQYIKDQSG